MVRAYSLAWIAFSVFLLSACSEKAPKAAAPTVMITANANSGFVGQSITLTWTSTEANSCTASDGWTGAKSASGNETIVPDSAGAKSFSLSCTGAGGSGSASTTVTVNAVTSTGTAFRYLENGSLALGELDTAFSSGTPTVTTMTGPAFEFKVATGNVLYFLAPEEQFGDSRSIVRIDGGGKSLFVAFDWTSRLGPAIVQQEGDGGEESSPSAQAAVKLRATGLTGADTINATTTSVSFTLEGGKALSAPLSSLALETATGTQTVTDWFSFDPAAVRYTLKAERLSDFLGAVRLSERATLMLSLATPGYDEVYNLQHRLVYGGATINVALLNASGGAATDLVGAAFTIRGLDTGYSAKAVVGADGTMAFTSLPRDSYEIREVVYEARTALAGFAVLTNGAATVALTISRAPVLTGATIGSPNSAQSPEATTQLSQSYTSSSFIEPGAIEYADPKRLASVASVPPSVAQPNVYDVSVSSGARDQRRASPISYDIPQGSSQIFVKVDITTAEYPTYTTVNSRFNDLWSFTVIPPVPFAKFENSGKVNTTHSTKGTISEQKCYDVSSQTKNASVKITGEVASINIGDSLLATTVRVTIDTKCPLTITKFDGKEVANDGYPIIYPRKPENGGGGNVLAQYISMPRKVMLPENFGIPSIINFSPTTAKITSVELIQRNSAADVSLGTTYLAQSSTPISGKIDFAHLLLTPNSSLNPVSGRIQIMARVRGTVDGIESVSEPFPLTVAGVQSFFPLYRAADIMGISDVYRYPTPHPEETGGDDWATYSMAQWIALSGLRFNDISAANLRQFKATPPASACGGYAVGYGSVLCHSGHSDGQQVDVRYADGNGGYQSDSLSQDNAAGLNTLANAAKAEAANASLTSRPNLDRLVRWIKDNRSIIEQYDARGEVRRVFVGKKHVAELLISGMFPGTTTPVPTIIAWTKPSKVYPADAHLDHWHISTRNIG